MDKEQILNIIKEIGTNEDEVKRREMLTGLSDNISSLFDKQEEDKNTISSLNETINTHLETISKNNQDMEDLRQANMKMFLKLGKEDTTPVANKIDTTDEEKPKRKFEDLFKENK